MKILMIEDNESVAEMMEMFFEKEKWEATFFHDGQKGYDHFTNHQQDYDMIILDLNLPGKDGMMVCRDIRQLNTQVPIIMLTARDSESDQVLGLEMGADDYVTKPFSPLTLIARIQALYRRSQMSSANQETISSDFDIQTEHTSINLKTREAYYRNQLIENLTPKEFDILALLASHPKQVFSREHLLNKIWEDPFYGDERTIDAHIKKLRQKLEVVDAKIIQTVWGVGYKFDDTSED